MVFFLSVPFSSPSHGAHGSPKKWEKKTHRIQGWNLGGLVRWRNPWKTSVAGSNPRKGEISVPWTPRRLWSNLQAIKACIPFFPGVQTLFRKAKIPAFGNLRTKGCHISIGCYHCGMVPNKKALGTPSKTTSSLNLPEDQLSRKAWACREAPAASSSCNFVASHLAIWMQFSTQSRPKISQKPTTNTRRNLHPQCLTIQDTTNKLWL